MAGKVVLAEFKHETNTFSTRKTKIADFQKHREYFGEEIQEKLLGTNNELGGALNYGLSKEIDMVPVLSASATPGGIVSDDAYELYSHKIISKIKELKEKIDGIFLALHGAMVCEKTNDGEGSLIQKIRKIVGKKFP